MMTKQLSTETIQKIRREVLSGKTKYQIAKELGISDKVVLSYEGYSLETSGAIGDTRTDPQSVETTLTGWLCSCYTG
jgi:FixJ family two-component response regulator